MPDKPNRAELRLMADQFLAVQSPEQLAELLDFNEAALHALALAPEYEVFHVPKKNGEQRRIEDPKSPLKGLQRRINRHLQAVFYFLKTEAAFGFVTNAEDDPLHEQRHIVNHAKLHLQAPWLLNMDVEDFFHFVSDEQIQRIFQSPPFNFGEELAALLRLLCQLDGRLPMGAPTSPSISNFAMHDMDLALEKMSRSLGWTYSRYADDFSFSSGREITADHIEELRSIIRHFKFEPNERKTRLFGPTEAKEVTGIVLTTDGKLDLPDAFFAEIEEATQQLAMTLALEARYANERTFWTREFEQEIGGMLAFAKFALGERHQKVVHHERAFQKALTPPDYRAVSWLDFQYPNW